MENVDSTPIQAKNYYSRSIWWSDPETDLKRSDTNGVNGGFYFDAGRDYYGYNSQEIVTPEISETFEDLKRIVSTRNRVDDISEEAGGTGDSEENGDYDVPYSRQILSTEIVEIVGDGKSITSNKDRRVDDLYVAVGEDDLDVVKWALHHAVSPGARIFLVHVSPPITLIPTPGKHPTFPSFHSCLYRKSVPLV